MTAVAVNFTAFSPAEGGYLKADKNEATPNDTVSYLHWEAGVTQTNSGVLAVGTGGKIQVMSTSSTNLFIDVQGYYTAGDPSAGGYVPVTQTRLVDTRNGTGLPQAKLASGSTPTIQVGGLAGVPIDASAAMLNFLVVNQSGGGHIDPYPSDQPQLTRSLNFGNDGADATGAMVALSRTGTPAGAFNLNVAVNGGTLDVVVDVLGYFTAAESGATFTPAAARVLDTRDATPDDTLAGDATQTIQVTGVGGVPNNGIGAVALNLIVPHDGGTNDGYLRAWPSTSLEPDPALGLRYHAGETMSNMIVVALGSTGAVKVHNLGSDPINIVIDVEGWCAAAGPQAPQVTSPDYPANSALPRLPAPGEFDFSVFPDDPVASDPLNPTPPASWIYHLDSGSEISVPSTQSAVYIDPINGDHVLHVRAVDSFGVSSSVTDYPFTVRPYPAPGPDDATGVEVAASAINDWTLDPQNGWANAGTVTISEDGSRILVTGKGGEPPALISYLSAQGYAGFTDYVSTPYSFSELDSEAERIATSFPDRYNEISLKSDLSGISLTPRPTYYNVPSGSRLASSDESSDSQSIASAYPISYTAAEPELTSAATTSNPRYYPGHSAFGGGLIRSYQIDQAGNAIDPATTVTCSLAVSVKWYVEDYSTPWPDGVWQKGILTARHCNYLPGDNARWRGDIWGGIGSSGARYGRTVQDAPQVDTQLIGSPLAAWHTSYVGYVYSGAWNSVANAALVNTRSPVGGSRVCLSGGVSGNYCGNTRIEGGNGTATMTRVRLNGFMVRGFFAHTNDNDPDHPLSKVSLARGGDSGSPLVQYGADKTTAYWIGMLVGTDGTDLWKTTVWRGNPNVQVEHSSSRIFCVSATQVINQMNVEPIFGR